MKKQIYFLVSLLALIGFSMNVSAQSSTGINPYVNDVKTYTVAAHDGNTYLWSLQSVATGAGADLINAGTNPVATATAPFSGKDKNSISITWANPIIGTIYYLHVTETDPSGCSNRKVLAIQPVNNFKMDIVNVDNAGNALSSGDATDHSICTEAIPSTISWNGGADPVNSTNATDFSYNYGSSTFYYKITATGLNFATTSWTPSITIAKVGGSKATQTIETKLGGAITDGSWGSGPTLAIGTNAPTISAGAGNTVIWVKVTVSNLTGTPTSANENIEDNDFTFTINAASKDQYDNTVTSRGNETTTQTQKARPNTGVIGY